MHLGPDLGGGCQEGRAWQKKRVAGPGTEKLAASVAQAAGLQPRAVWRRRWEQNAPRLRALFELLDEDGDGEISRADLERMYDAWKSMAASGEDEVTASARAHSYYSSMVSVDSPPHQPHIQKKNS